MNYNHYYTCGELIKKYPLTTLWGWNDRKIGVFFNCLLLDGKKFGKNKRTMVKESSFVSLIQFVESSVAAPRHSTPEYLSYEEIMERIPQAQDYRWSNSNLGIFYHSKLLMGKMSKKESCVLIEKQSVLRLIKYTNQRFIAIANKPIDGI